MTAGDGLLVRVRPRLGRLTVPQAIGLAKAARSHGNGLIDLTNRAALQLRGVTEQSHAPLLRQLIALGLADPDPGREARGNVLLTPDSSPGDDTENIALSLIEHLDEMPELPPKIGIAIDAGPAPCLAAVPADFRFERSATGVLLLRMDGRMLGSPTRGENAARDLSALLHWFLATGGAASGRAARHKAPLPTVADVAPAPSRPPSQALAAAAGPFHGIPFGQFHADSLIALAEKGNVCAVRITPWRGLILEGAKEDADNVSIDRLLGMDACPGAPACPQASVATRSLASRLAPLVNGSLHVSGCAKGCARQAPADLVLTGRQGRFDLSRNGPAGSSPELTGMTADQVLAHFGRP